MEQTVSKGQGAGARIAYMLVCVAAVLLLVLALFFAANVIGTDAGGALSIGWLALIACLLLLGSAYLLWRAKDRLNVEYDYAIRDGRIEVVAVLNNRRRALKLRLELDRILACGRGMAIAGAAERLYLNPENGLVYMQYEGRGGRRTALLELNDDMTAALRRGIQRGVWREDEGKN